MKRPSYLLPHAENNIVITHGDGCWLYTSSGKKILDFGAGYATASMGYGENPVSEKIAEKAKSLIHASSCDFATPEYLKLASFFKKQTDSYYKNPGVYIGLSGAEVVEASLKLLSLQNKPGTLIVMEGGFHGRTLGALSVGSSDILGKKKYPLIGMAVERVPFPETQDEIGELEQKLNNIAKETCVLAVIAEPILGESGYKFPPKGFLALLRKFTKTNDAYLVFDEIQTGIGRTGFLFSFEDEGVVPDIFFVAKGTASGLPIGVMVFSLDDFDVSEWDHASTFSGNVLSCTAALETLRIINTHEFLDDVKNKGRILLSALNKLVGQYPVMVKARGKGLMAAFDINSSQKLRDDLIDLSLQEGLLLLHAGKKAIRISPPLIISEEEIKIGIGILAKSLSQLSKFSNI